MNSIGHGSNDSKSQLRAFLGAHPLFGEDEALIADAAECAELVHLGFDDLLIGMGRQDCDLYLIFSGSLDIIIDGREVARRTKGEMVGELELVSPHIKRMATVVARDKTKVGCIAERDFTRLAEKHPVLWRNIAKELVRRLIGETTQ